MTDPNNLIPADLSPGLLADLLIAWAEGEVSGGWLVDTTNIDLATLRGMKNAAIERALAWGKPIAEAKHRESMGAVLREQPPGRAEEFLASRPEYRSAYERRSRGEPTTDLPSSSNSTSG